MSSLAGALAHSQHVVSDAPFPTEEKPPSTFSTSLSADIEMLPPVHAELSPMTDQEEEQDEEMTDLFGNDNDVEEAKHEG